MGKPKSPDSLPKKPRRIGETMLHCILKREK
jgi:hypothetical protein